MEHTDAALLARIRHLLAKAESTTFEAEAIAFTSKAQELMTRHAIDAATLHTGTAGHSSQPITRRIVIHAPYVNGKALLLQTVATASRCQAVQHVGDSASSVVGFPDDIAAVEVMFTSLLVQAQAALADAARRAPAGTRPRSRSYRSAFLRGFTHRIGQRLREINEAVYADVEAERGTSVLPALRSRAEEVDAHFATTFSGVTRSRVRGGYDHAGWTGGAIAAESARLNAGVVDRKTA